MVEDRVALQHTAGEKELCVERLLACRSDVGPQCDEFEAALPHLPFAYMQARMQELEDACAVEIAGDVWAMRYSEVRLVVRRNEV